MDILEKLGEIGSRFEVYEGRIIKTTVFGERGRREIETSLWFSKYHERNKMKVF